MITTDKEICKAAVELLSACGVTDAVVSPGSRNAPLIVAAERCQGLATHVVIDERTAAFFGLGIALSTRRPVALICTSGSAVLNYAPAVAEAYYRRIPLIVISADRPAEWIDQDDSQTIRQDGVLDNIVKGSWDIDGENAMAAKRRHALRSINDAIATAVRGPQGPVHINIRLDEPLGGLREYTDTAVPIHTIGTTGARLSAEDAERLAERIAGKKTLVIAGFGLPDRERDEAVGQFVKASGAVLLHEAQSNIHLPGAVANIDATLSAMDSHDRELMRPEAVITFGGALLSRMVKQYLRDSDGIEHLHISASPKSIDCFLHLTETIDIPETVFFKDVANAIEKTGRSADRTYASLWAAKSAECRAKAGKHLAESDWSDFVAMGGIMSMIPRGWRLHLSNGTAVRYAQLFDYSTAADIECNRGVSGIDGSTATAIGAHLASPAPTLLISGDMSAQYDMGALAIDEITPRFKMAVLNNQGGGIFRFIKSTSRLAELDKCFAAKVRLPLRSLAEGFGFAYFEASDAASLESSFAHFAAEAERPAILNIITPARQSADILKDFFSPK